MKPGDNPCLVLRRMPRFEPEVPTIYHAFSLTPRWPSREFRDICRRTFVSVREMGLGCPLGCSVLLLGFFGKSQRSASFSLVRFHLSYSGTNSACETADTCRPPA